MTDTDVRAGDARNVTMLFSDIEGSTVLLRRLAGDWGAALDVHRRVCREAWEAWSGREMGTEGDSFFVVFDNAAAAAGAAAQAQRELMGQAWPEDARVQVRIGLHTGTPTPHGDGYVGMDVHRAARIAAAAHGGQIVVSNATAALIERDLPEGSRLSDLGQHRLKDIVELEHLFQLTTETGDSFRPLRTLGSPTRLPSYFAPLLGREEDLEQIVGLLGTGGGSEPVRLVSVLAPGGTGKTRLAVAAAERLSTGSGGFPDGVHFVDLSEATDAPAMWATLGSSLDLPVDQRASPDVITQLSTRESLLVLDNLEQVAEAGVVVDRILQSAPGLRVLATSRRPLHVPGEREYTLAPMGLPGVDADPSQAVESAAVRLFVQYATMAKSSFVLDADNTAAVVEICRRLDGLPLAIELVATRVKLFTAPALLARLGNVLDLSSQPAGRREGTPRGARPGRQQTLRQAIAWSYDLLDPLLQRAFATFGIFVGQVGLEDLEAVLPSEVLEAHDVIDLVAELQDASLLVIGESSAGEPTVSMLETIRAYARDQLEATGEHDRAAAAHANHFAHRAQWLLDNEHGRALYTTWPIDNVYLALTWCVRKSELTAENQRDGAVLHELCKCVSDSVGNQAELLAIADKLLAGPIHLTASGHVSLLITAAELAEILGDLPLAHGYLDRALNREGELSEGTQRRLLRLTALVELDEGRLDDARRYLEQERPLISRDDILLEWMELMAWLEYSDGHFDVAIASYQEMIRIYERQGDGFSADMLRHNLACAQRLAGRVQEALATMRLEMPFFFSLKAMAHVIALGEDFGACLAQTGHDVDAARVWGAIEAARAQHQLPRTPIQSEEVEPAYDLARSALGPTAWAEAEAEGRRWELHDLMRDIDTALG